MLINKLSALLSIFFLLHSYSYGQNVNSFYLRLNQYNYPSHPLPTNCEVYGVSSNINNRNIFAYKPNGDKLVLKDLNTSSQGLYPKLFSFSKYHKSTIPYDNGFLLNINIDDVELYHEYSGKDNIYNIYSKYKLVLSITHKKNVIIGDTINYNDIEGSFVSSLSPKDVHIIANNKESELAHNLNSKILSKIVYPLNTDIKDLIDLSFSKDYIKFYGISKAKKLISEDQIKSLGKRIKNLESLDKNILNRDEFNTELNSLITLFSDLKKSKDYTNYNSFKSYAHANLASLYTLKEDFNKAGTNYDYALLYNNKDRFNTILKEEKLKMKYKKENKQILFNDDNFNDSYSTQYLKTFKTRKRKIN